MGTHVSVVLDMCAQMFSGFCWWESGGLSEETTVDLHFFMNCLTSAAMETICFHNVWNTVV